MSLERISVEIRSRGAQQANDLGFALVRRFAGAVFVPWLMLLAPFVVAASVLAAQSSDAVWLGLLFLWWTRPLLERVPRFVLSRAIFGQVPEPSQTLSRSIRSWLSLRTLAELTLARVFPYRAFSDVVWELEQLSGKRASERSRHLLADDGQSNLALLLLVFHGFGWAFFFGGLTGIGVMVPESFGIDVGGQFEALLDGTQKAWFSVAVVLLYGAVIGFLHPFYVGCCFAQYLGRRVALEGWDIELVFRRLRERLVAATAVVAMMFAGLTWAPADVHAQTGGVPDAGLVAEPVHEGDDPVMWREDSAVAQIPERPEVPAHDPHFVAPDDPDPVIAEILAAEEFGRTVKKTKWVPKEPDGDGEVERSGGGLPGLGTAIEGLLWALAGAGVLFALAYVVRNARTPLRRRDRESTAAVRTESHALPDTELSLPAHLLPEARSAWERGDAIGSLSLLYRGLIAELVAHYDLEIGDDATAREVVRIVSDAGGPSDYVRRLGRAWTMAVYADRDPTDEEASALFDEWDRRFGRGR